MDYLFQFVGKRIIFSNLFRSSVFENPQLHLYKKVPLNRGLVLQPHPHCKETISKFNVYNALKNYVVPTSNSNYDRKQILICCLLRGHTSGGVEQHGPQKQHIMLLVPFREGVKKNRLFLGNSPKQRTPPTHRSGLGLT